METNPGLRFLEVSLNLLKAVLPVLFAVLVVALLFIVTKSLADSSAITVDGDGVTIQGTQTTCGSTATNSSCIDDVVSSSSPPSTSGDYITFSRTQSDTYTFGPLTSAATTTQIDVKIYHQEGNGNMNFDISLWNASESTQIGTTQTVTNSQLSVWSNVSFTGLTLTQSDLDGLRIRTTCNKAGGQGSTCRDFALFAEVTYQPVIDLTVSSSGSQHDLEIGTSSAYIGGQFAIKENVSSRNISSIKITENGSVNAQNNLSNIKLWYDLDTSAPYDCASESFDGNETQYGTTASSFSGANGTITFSDTVGISTTTTLCAYVTLDVGNGASPGQEIQLEISNPSTDVVGTGSATVEPSTVVALSGTTTLLASLVEQMHYHWRNDNGGEADPGGATSATGGSEDTPLTALSQGSQKRLRFELSNEGNLATNETVKVLDGFTTGNTKTISSGKKRLLLVGIHYEHSQTNTNVNTVTYGGQTLTEVGEQVALGTLFENGMWVGYLDEAGIEAATNTDIVETWNGPIPDTARLYSSVVLENVDQTDPLTGTSGNTGINVSTIQPTSSISVASGNIAMYFTVSGATGETHTPASGYTEGTEQDSGGSGSVAANAYKLITGSGTEQPTADWTNTQNRLAIVALSVQAAHKYQIEYAQKSSTCANATGWTNVGAAGADWEMFDSTNLTNGNDTTDISTSIGGVSNENSNFLSPNGGVLDTSSVTGALILTSTDYVELEYSIIATTTATEGNTYCFRVSDQGQALDGYSVYPEATIAADLAVSATGTQATFEDIPSTNVYGGGAFVVKAATAGVRTLSSITVTASGTVDYAHNIQNVELWYDLDTSAPYDCSSESYSGNETQFGTTQSSFSAAGTSTFSGDTVSASTTQSICFYVLYDVGASTTNGKTLDLEIADPPVDISVDTGSISPSSLVAISGVTSFVSDTPTQIHYHWRNNDGGEGTGGATSATGGSEDTTLTGLTKESPIRLRFEVSNEGGTTTGPIQYRLEYTQKVSTCSLATGWTDIASGGAFELFDSANLTDGSDTTNISTTTGGVSDENITFLTPNGGQKDTSSQTGNITLTESEFVELEYSLQASSSAASGGTYCFRLTNAGTPLKSYSVYPEATVKLDTDFFVQRGVVTITGTSSTIVAGVDYTAPGASTSAFVRITNSHNTGAGPNTGTGNSNSVDVTAYIIDPSNVQNSITFARPGSTNSNTRVDWEIVEYKGSPAGENEMIVRGQGTLTYGASSLTATTSAISGVSSSSKVAVFITGQYNPDAGRFNFNTTYSTAVWNATSSTATFTRGEAGSDAVIVSYAIVEFTGSNWTVQRVRDHTYTNAGSTETESISPVGSLSRAFIHTQIRVGTGLDTHEDQGQEVWLSGVGQVSYRLDSGANTPSGHVAAVWVIENAQTEGDVMEVTRSNGTQSGGASPLPINTNIGKTLDDLTVSSIFMNNSGSGSGRSYPEPFMAARLISTTQYELWVSDTGDSRSYRTEIVEWPTAQPNFTQNNYHFYVNNGQLLPTDAWPAGAGDIGEDAEITGLDSPLASGDSIRIRMTVQVNGSALPAGIDAFKLQYAKRVSTCTAISEWSPLGNIGSTTAIWRGSSTPIADGTTLGTLRISSADVAGTFEEENNTALTPNTALAGEDIEYDWSIEDNGAPEKTDYCFRMVESDNTQFVGYNFYPVIRTIGYGAQSQDWKWYDDSENETPTAELAGTNTAPIDIDFDNSIQLRLTLREVNGGTATNTKFKLQFSEYSDFSTSTDVAEIGNCGDLSYWCYADGGGNDNATITTRTLGDADSCLSGVGDGCGTHNESGTSTSSFTHSGGQAKEFAFTIRQAGARVNTVYYFRAYDVASDEVVPLGTGQSYPSLSTKGASLSFALTGVSSSTVIDGLPMNIDTSPTKVAFGTLPVGTAVAGAYQIGIATNGTQGYKVLMYTTSDFLDQKGEKINNVLGTNASPSGWSTGCLSTANSCFGYHTDDSVLENGSTRFAANDSYAAVSSTTPEEVAYNSSATSSPVTNIVYRIKIGDLQPAGQYETNVAFIAIPIF